MKIFSEKKIPGQFVFVDHQALDNGQLSLAAFICKKGPKMTEKIASDVEIQVAGSRPKELTRTQKWQTRTIFYAFDVVISLSR